MSKFSREVILILYVRDQQRSAQFYSQLLDTEPSLDVPGMTEIPLTAGSRLGLMPGDGIVRILDQQVNNPNENDSTPRCELYLYVENPDHCYEKALALGGRGISPGAVRNWGDYAAYCADFDGNILAFAKRI